MLHNALPAYAEANSLVVLYPQAADKANPVGGGCWDWEGYTTLDFDTKRGVQIRAVVGMIQALPELLRRSQ